MKQNISIKKDERGMMVVEAIIGFTAFIVVCLMITFLINIFMVHNRIQYAINQAAHEIASYAYFYDALSVRDADNTLSSDSQGYTKDIDDSARSVMDTITKLNQASADISGSVQSVSKFDFSTSAFEQAYDQMQQTSKSIESAVDSGKQSITSLKNLFSDPGALLAGIVYVAADEGVYAIKHLVGQGASWALTSKYLETDTRTADEYLRSFGVIDGYDGLDFSGSSLFADAGKRLVDVVVEYDIDLSFSNFVLPMKKVHVVQRASVAAWVGGDGKQVK